VPIGVDLELFNNKGDRRRTLPVITTANFWGAERTIQKSLSSLARTTHVTWFGANGEHLVVDSAVHHANRVNFFGLPSIYARSVVVVDDLIDSAKAYGNQNSRLFEAIASGAVPVTNTRLGLDSLGLGEVPSYSDEQSLAATVEALLSSPTSTGELAERLRETVVARHSYASRAADVQPHLAAAVARASSRGERSPLLAWANAERRRLQSAESLRDGHLITIRRMEREHEQLQRKLDTTTARLDEFRSSRWARLSLRIQRRLARLRK
jgi:glycosyltransferase involved in cell wall biosynthesis